MSLAEDSNVQRYTTTKPLEALVSIWYELQCGIHCRTPRKQSTGGRNRELCKVVTIDKQILMSLLSQAQTAASMRYCTKQQLQTPPSIACPTVSMVKPLIKD